MLRAGMVVGDLYKVVQAPLQHHAPGRNRLALPYVDMAQPLMSLAVAGLCKD